MIPNQQNAQNILDALQQEIEPIMNTLVNLFDKIKKRVSELPDTDMELSELLKQLPKTEVAGYIAETEAIKKSYTGLLAKQKKLYTLLLNQDQRVAQQEIGHTISALVNETTALSNSLKSRPLTAENSQSKILASLNEGAIKAKEKVIKVYEDPRLSKLNEINKSETYYDVLGVLPDAEISTIRRAFRDLALKTHPDKNVSDDPQVKIAAEKAFVKINEAYATLSDINKRQEYDEALRESQRPSM